MRKPEDIGKTLTEYCQRILAAPMQKKAEEWKDVDFAGWEPGRNGVYILWRRKDDITKNIPPVYIGQGHLGPRVWNSFYNRDWQYAQIFTDDIVSGTSKECRFWRKALERFCILVFEPEENID